MENNTDYFWKWILIIFLSLIVLAILVTAFKVEWMSEEDSDKIIELLNSVPLHQETNIDTLHSEICDKVPESPICWNIELLRRIDIIGQSKWVPTRLLIWVAYAESHIGVNFNREACRGYNNWFWLKGKKYDTWKVVWFTKNKKADSNWCWLYKFESIEDGFYSLANTISVGYKGCKNDTKCLSYGYVWNPDVPEQSWINHVSMWY